MSEIDNAELKVFFDQLCDAAAGETLPRFRSNTDVANKLTQGFDPVTEADREAERVIRDILTEKFPDHGIIGEEHGITNPTSPWQWIIDPIDGTRAFISGIPVWGTLIGLYHDGKPYAGVMDQPFTAERFYGLQDGGHRTSFLSKGSSKTPLKTSVETNLKNATLMTTDPYILQAEEDAGYHQLAQHAKLRRYGCDCYAYCMVAQGSVELVVESGLNIYDIAPLISIIEGAGGLVTNWQGDDCSKGGQILAAANATLHQKAMDVLNS